MDSSVQLSDAAQANEPRRVGSRRKLKMGESELRTLLEGNQSFVSLSTQLGVSATRLGYLNAGIRGTRTGMERQEARELERKEAVYQEAEDQLLDTYPMSRFVEKARSMGFDVRAAPRIDKRGEILPGVRRDVLYIGDKLCSVHITQAMYSGGVGRVQDYAHCSHAYKTVMEAEYECVHALVPGYPESTFIVACPEFVLAYFPKPKRYAYTMVPLQDVPVYRNHKKRIDWWGKQRDAWHLLRGEKK